MCRMVTVQTGVIPLGVGLHPQVAPETYRQNHPALGWINIKRKLCSRKFRYAYYFNLIREVPRFLKRRLDLPVSVGVQAPIEMPRSGNEVMSKVAKRIADFRLTSSVVCQGNIKI